MKRSLVLIVFFFFGMAELFAQPESTIMEARTLIGEGSYASAIQVLRKAIEGGEKSPEILHWLGVGYHSALQFEQAVAAFDEALAMRPAIRTYLSLGRSLTSMGRGEDALGVYDKALEIDTTHQAVIIEKARLHAGLREFSQAVRYYQKLIKRDSLNAYLLLQLADCYKGLGDADAAIVGYERVRRIRNNQLRPYLELYSLYNARQAYLSSSRVLNDGLRVMPDNTILLKRRGDLYTIQEQYKEALEEYEAAFARKDTSLSLLRAKGIAHYRLGQYEKAIPLLNKAVTASENAGLDQVAAFYLGVSYQQLKRYNEAMTLWDKLYTELAKGLLPDVLNQMGKNYDSRNLSQKAKESYELAYKVDPANVDALFFLAVWHENKQLKNKAISYFDQFLRVSGGNQIYKALAKQRLAELRPPKPSTAPESKVRQ